jgi:hypothetical protein
VAKRRTKKQKLNVHHSFTLNWTPEARVKSQFASANNFPAGKAKKPKREEKAVLLAQGEATSKIKRNILKSLIIVSLILASEVVIYLAWYVR